ncbi:putative entry exclusion protein TrbK-alt [Komagataeibacter rhaeticus]|nr:putative entry exclusion protein TrbK-alt [Komagataeibacter rhaeticus]
MRWPQITAPTGARIIAVVMVAAILAAAGWHAGHKVAPTLSGVPVRIMTPVPSSDPLAAGLARCEALGLRADGDAGCAAIWAENRRRFLGDAKGH